MLRAPAWYDVKRLPAIGDDDNVRMRVEGDPRRVADFATLGDDARRATHRIDSS